MSASPLRTASNVPGGAATARGSALHLILPATFCSSIAHHSTCVVVNAWVGGTQDDSANVVCAAAGASPAIGTARHSRAARAARAADKGMADSSLRLADSDRTEHTRPIAENAGAQERRRRGTRPCRTSIDPLFVVPLQRDPAN